MSDEPTLQGTELAMLRGEVMTALARIEGDIRLVLQAQQAAERRHDDLQRDVRQIDGRVDMIERTAITRDELDARDARMRADLEEKARRKLTVVGIMITVVNLLVGSGLTIIAIIAK